MAVTSSSYEEVLSSSQLSEFVEWTDRACTIVDEDGKFVQSNQLANEIITPKEIASLSIHKWECTESILKKHIQLKGVPYSCTRRKIELHNHLFYHVTFDPTDTKREIPVLNDVVGYVMDSAQEGIYITDGEGYTLKINETYSLLTDIHKQDVEGKHVSELITLGYFDSSVTAKVLKYREKVSIMQRINNERNIWLVTGIPVFDSHNHLILIINTVYDMTKLNDLQEKLKKQNVSIKKQEKEIQRLRSKIDQSSDFVAQSPAMDIIVERINRLAEVSTSALIQGETGTGKNVIAERIHSLSKRKNKPFIEVNCGAIPEQLFESELFGYKKGAFTGASGEGKKGLIEAADGGTIFLDEIGELPVNLQVKLLTVLQSKRVRRIGDVKDRHVDVRIIAATNKEPETLIKTQKLREDLYYRLSVVTLKLPPLRERKEDIYLLTKFFLDKFNERHEKKLKFAKEVFFAFEFYQWPGNIRELEHLVEQLVVLNDGPIIGTSDLSEPFQELAKPTEENRPLKEAVRAFEKSYILELWNKHKNMYTVAEMLGIHRTTLLRKAEKLGIDFTH
ncbi:Transcriptional regulator containing PAS, AAA-type ATPase, and DNA-binding Fis domains [Thalassobacillus cyri]|uniref:HTH-type transcriptional regulatory protein TyrR n=1 Tax=Thalassobacillus cyri TaxID=571932 RepID=A0A1H3W0N4_9BACI|nr:sigma 54-interacting transcriptional regulator [Thalassobacillus cyri]SDZ80004.1 Transcriptional regulator containing PAS, AAA-type ATPase, and DNA-binding Fis domains [Thalassobacillus cyri]